MFVFIFGCCVGAALVLAWQNKDKIIETIKSKLAG